MHYVAEFGSTPFLQWLFDIRAHDMMLAKDRHGKTPLNVAERQSRSRRVFYLLLQGYMDKVASQQGNCGLHWILRTASYENGEIVLPAGTLGMGPMLLLLILFVSVNSNIISTSDGEGALPLHIACQNSKIPIQIIRYLVEQDPSNVHRVDKQGNLPIHTLCASRSPLYTVKYLHRSHGSSIAVANRMGRSPFMVAALTSASLNVLWYLMTANTDIALASLRQSL